MKFYMAPLQSYTTSFYRRAHALTFGAMDKYFTPFFEDRGKPIHSIKFEPELKSRLNDKLNIVPQTATNNAHFLLFFAQEMQNRGFKEINLNMGCPFPMLVKRGRGGGLLGCPEALKQLLKAFEKVNTGMKLSVKMRLGIDSVRQGRDIINILNDYPLEELILHPRLVSQKYTGVPDWDSFALFHKLSKHPMAANGDIKCKRDLDSLNERFSNVDSFMLGRGLLSCPELYSELREGSCRATDEVMKEFHHHYFTLITSYYKDWNRAFNFLQSFWHYPLSTSAEKQRHLRKLKKHNKPNLYAAWLQTANSLF